MTITVDKEDAKLLLQMNSKKNRDVENKKVNYYKWEMNSGKWELRGSAIEIKDNELVNGQHRLLAFIESDLSTITFKLKVA